MNLKVMIVGVEVKVVEVAEVVIAAKVVLVVVEL